MGTRSASVVRLKAQIRRKNTAAPKERRHRRGRHLLVSRRPVKGSGRLRLAGGRSARKRLAVGFRHERRAGRVQPRDVEAGGGKRPPRRTAPATQAAPYVLVRTNNHLEAVRLHYCKQLLQVDDVRPVDRMRRARAVMRQCLPRHQETHERHAPLPQARAVLVRLVQRKGTVDKRDRLRIFVGVLERRRAWAGSVGGRTSCSRQRHSRRAGVAHAHARPQSSGHQYGWARRAPHRSGPQRSLCGERTISTETGRCYGRDRAGGPPVRHCVLRVRPTAARAAAGG